MTPERWERIQLLFHAALELEQSERAEFIEQECVEDPLVAVEVTSLLEAHEGEGLIGSEPESNDRTTQTPERIGPYRILMPLGQGGMGAVYLAERDGVGFTQRVAIKLLRAGFADPLLGNRLLAERRILAQLEHPGIARLIDGGTTADGQPYFAMEYVEGLNLARYCEQHPLTIADRLRLFLEICAAVQFAHQHLIVHRDLKPSNIMVSDNGHPKLLDFGIAKLLDPAQGLEGATLTLPCFTPTYASPEQVRGRQVGTPSDIYSLGMVLYETLTGTVPYEVDSKSPGEIERIVCDTAPTRPSERVVKKRLRRLLVGDLDTIVLKALAKEPSRRYGSVEQLADDVRRHLNGLPVLARPESMTYRLGKFLARNRTGTAAAALVAVSLVGGTLAAGWQARRASTQRDIATEEARKAAQVTGLMVDLFRLSDPTATLGDTVTARELLDRGVERIEAEFGDQPDLQAEVLVEVARVYTNLGLLGRAEQLASQALDIRTALHGAQSIEISTNLDQLGELHAAQGNLQQATDFYRRAVTIRAGALTRPDSLLAHMQSELAFLLRSSGQHDEAAELFAAALETQRAILGNDQPEVATTLFGLAATHHDRGSFDEAEALFQNALADYDLSSGKPHPMAAAALLNVGMIRRLREQYQSSEPLLQSAVTMRSALYDLDHPDVIEAVAEYGIVLTELGRYDEAERVLTDGLLRANRSLGWEHPYSSTLRESLAILEVATGRYTAPVARFDTSLTAKRARFGNNHPQILFTVLRSARPLIESGDLPAAESRLDEALAMGDPGSRAVSSLLALHGKAQIELMRGRLVEANRYLDEAESIAAEQLRESHRYTLAVKRDRAALWLAQGRPDDVVTLLQKVLEDERMVRPPPHPRVGNTLRLLGAAYLAQGQADLAQHTLRAARAEFRQLPEWHWEVGETESLLGAALLAQGKREQAQVLLEQGFQTVSNHRGRSSRAAIRAASRLSQIDPDDR